MEIEFKRKTKLVNGSLIKKDNWHTIIAKSTTACTGVSGVAKIDEARRTGGYYESWVIKKEPEGYIFREINHNGGICGHHKTPRLAVLTAIGYRIKITIQEGGKNDNGKA
jgi:hypothetical protein